MPDRELMEQLDRAVHQVLAGESPDMERDPELAALAAIASELRDLPSESFKTRLKADLKRRAEMSTLTAAKFRTVAPFLIHARGPEMADFIHKTFEAEEVKRNTGPEFYSEMKVGDSVIMIAGGTAAQYGNLPSALHVYVDDCDAAYRRALDAGSVTLMGERGEPADRPYGERSAFVQDPFGNFWYIATRLAGAPEGFGSVLPYLHPAHARKYIDFLQRAFGADEMAVYEDAGRVMHAMVRLGDAVVELGEPEDRAGIPLNGLFFFVDDVDAVYARAIEAGATTVRPPNDMPSGLRSAVMKDPEGYFWWPARWEK